MLPHRLPPSTYPLPTASTSDVKPLSGTPTADNMVPNSALAQMQPAQERQLPQAGTVTGSATTAGRKRHLSPLLAPRATRPHTNVGPATQVPFVPRSLADLQQRWTQIQQGIASTSDVKPALGTPTADNMVPYSALAQMQPAQQRQLLKTGTVTGSATTAERDRQLMPPPPPVPRANVGTTLQAALARSLVDPQRRAKIEQDITEVLNHFGMQWDTQSEQNKQALISSAIELPPARQPARHRPLDPQDITNIKKFLNRFGLQWDTLSEQNKQALISFATELPPVPNSPGVTVKPRRRQQPHAARARTQSQRAQDQTRSASQRPLVPQAIAPVLPVSLGPAPMGHYGGSTIDGPHLDRAGQQYFYLERQSGHACAQHAVNAMMGEPLVSLQNFAQWEANVQSPNNATPARVEDIAAAMQEQGVHLETVRSTLQSMGMPTHSFAHYRYDANAQGLQGLDRLQVYSLDSLETDRLLLQVDRYEGAGNSPTSHYVAFRRDGGQWVLLDSLHHEPQYRVAPSDYLLRDEGVKHFTAIWPQIALSRIQEQLAEPTGVVQRGMQPLSLSQIDDLPQESWDDPTGAAPRDMPPLSPSQIDNMIQELWAEPYEAAHGDGGQSPMAKPHP